MSDKNQDDAMLREKDLCSFGEKLKSTRENMGMTAQEAAARLHLSPRFISMLENDNLLESTLPLIYLRGYLRSYSRLLNIPETELALVLEKLDPKPVVDLEPAPAATESMSTSFPLENNPYLSRVATVIISLVLLTSITTWWYHHASKEAPTVMALDQMPVNPESVAQSNSITANSINNNSVALNSVAASPTPPSATNSPLQKTASQSPAPEQAKAPEAVDPGAKTPVALASVETEKNTHPLTDKPAMKHDESEDEGADEQE